MISTPSGSAPEKLFRLIGPDGAVHHSHALGALGGHRKLKIYGRLDCPSAARWIAKGHYAGQRVFFRNAEDAVAAGYRPCKVCKPDAFLSADNPKSR